MGGGGGGGVYQQRLDYTLQRYILPPLHNISPFQISDTEQAQNLALRVVSTIFNFIIILALLLDVAMP